MPRKEGKGGENGENLATEGKESPRTGIVDTNFAKSSNKLNF